MPYPMIHLHIVTKISELDLWPIKNTSQYYLGSISPDAVSFRETYDKRISHICHTNEQWGFIAKNDMWQSDVIKFIQENIGKYNTDFLLGYGIHILADIYNNIKIWTPYTLKYKNKNFKELHQIIFNENMLIRPV